MARRATSAARRRPNAKQDLQRHLTRALAELDGSQPPLDRSVHEARKELKRARSTLRLLRDAIGDPAYRRANRKLRDAARPLSVVRDAKALLEAVAKLRSRTKKGSRRSHFSSLERQLRNSQKRARTALVERAAELRKIRRSVESVLVESRQWPPATRDAAHAGVERIYRKGRKAFARADASRRETALHESRKQAKYLSRALEVVALPRDDVILKHAGRADSMADALGDDHDLALLRKRVTTRRSLSASARAGMLADIDRRRAELQRKASKRGHGLYRRKAKAFLEALDT
jgi:hypothetical protein